jgi:hypothetical protein
VTLRHRAVLDFVLRVQPGKTDISVRLVSEPATDVVGTDETFLALTVSVTVAVVLRARTAKGAVIQVSFADRAFIVPLVDTDIHKRGEAILPAHIIDADQPALALVIRVAVPFFRLTGPTDQTVVLISRQQGTGILPIHTNIYIPPGIEPGANVFSAD